MKKVTRRLTILFVIALLALLFIARPFASEINTGEMGQQMGESIYDVLTGTSEDGE